MPPAKAALLQHLQNKLISTRSTHTILDTKMIRWLHSAKIYVYPQCKCQTTAAIIPSAIQKVTIAIPQVSKPVLTSVSVRTLKTSAAGGPRTPAASGVRNPQSNSSEVPPPEPEVTSANRENAGLTEIITIYERMTKGRPEDSSIYRISKQFLPNHVKTHDDRAEETVAWVPSFHEANQARDSQYQQQELDHLKSPPVHPHIQAQHHHQQQRSQSSPPKRPKTNILDFNKYQSQHLRKYNFFSPATSLLQADDLEELSATTPTTSAVPGFMELLKSKHYWLNIMDPDENDLHMLSNSFSVHDLTLQDIISENSEEKIEIFKHYTFISLKLIGSETANAARGSGGGGGEIFDWEGQSQGQGKGSGPSASATAGATGENNDFDFNILLFKDFVITMHDKPWNSINDILGFLNLLCNTHTQIQAQPPQSSSSTSPSRIILTPDWVLFSIFIELKQDAKFLIDGMEPEINQIRLWSKLRGLHEMSDVMKSIFDMEFQIYTLSRFIKPKMNILRTLETKCDKRLNKVALKLITDIHDDFKDMSHEMEVASHILERSQDTVLGLVNVEKSKEQTELARVMNRLSQIALVFLPIQATAGFFGMNVAVPFQDQVGTTMYFWLIVSGSTALGFMAYGMRVLLLTKSFSLGRNTTAAGNKVKSKLKWGK